LQLYSKINIATLRGSSEGRILRFPQVTHFYLNVIIISLTLTLPPDRQDGGEHDVVRVWQGEHGGRRFSGDEWTIDLCPRAFTGPVKSLST